MKRLAWADLLPAAVVLAVLLLALAANATPEGGRLAAAGLAVLLLAPWALAAAVGVRAARRGSVQDALLALALILAAAAAALF